ncbi:MAG TPA: hypothetical protein VNZ45_17890 [Bacteroidia bacterium]|nr:hypothetical protein [Bacteroidia bacterium]
MADLFSQGPVTVPLTRKVSSSYSYNPKRNKEIGKIAHMRTGTPLLAGDFDDGTVKFTIAADIPPNVRNACQIYLAPYGADTVIVNNIKMTTMWNNQLLVVKAMGKEYSACIDTNRTAITFQLLEGHYSKPDISLYDSLMPAANFNLADGSKSSFTDYLHKNKCVYVVFWIGYQDGDIKEINDLKYISDLYRDKLTVISFQQMDTLTAEQIEKDKSNDWIDAKGGFKALQDFPVSTMSGGILYNSEGKAIAFDIYASELKATLESLLHMGY